MSAARVPLDDLIAHIEAKGTDDVELAGRVRSVVELCCSREWRGAELAGQVLVALGVHVGTSLGTRERCEHWIDGREGERVLAPVPGCRYCSTTEAHPIGQISR